MVMRSSMAVLALMAGLSGCASTSDKVAAGTTAPGDGVSGSEATTGALSDGGVSGKELAGTEKQAGNAGLDLRQSVYYEFDRYDVAPKYRSLAERHAAWLRANPGARLVIIGNTDERGPSEYNLALGQRRAESVTRLMVLLGARPEQIEAVSFGKEKPRATGHDEASWAENRRSDFTKP